MITPAQAQQFADEYLAGQSLAQIAAPNGCTPRTVQVHLEKMGIQRRSLSQANRHYTINEAAFNDQSNTDTQYWIGFLLADGCIHEHRSVATNISIELQHRDSNHLIKFQQFVGTNKPIYPLPKTNGIRLEVSSRIMAQQLSEVGIVPRKSKITSAPMSLQSSIPFWRGMLDGDGGIRIDRKGTPSVYLCGTPTIIKQFMEFVESVLDMHSNLQPYKVSNTLYTITYSRSIAIKLVTALYHNASTYLDRKYDKYTEVVQSHLNRDYRKLNKRVQQQWIETTQWYEQWLDTNKENISLNIPTNT